MTWFFFGVLIGICVAVGQSTTVIVKGRGELMIVEYDHKLYRLVEMESDK